MRLSVFGLGKLGAPAAAVFAARGHFVIGCDVNASNVEAIAQGRAPIDEPRLQEMIDAGRERLTATLSCDEAVQGSDVSFVIVPTPTQSDGTFTNVFVLEALEKIGAALRNKRGRHIVVVTSTVMPGSTDGPLRNALERASGLSVGSELGLCYNPEFIALGSVINDMLMPDFTLIGESDAQTGDTLAEIYAKTCLNAPLARRMSFVNAELTKIAINTYVTTKISYANMLAAICDQLPGADVAIVSGALGADSRIGAKYLTGATGYGGPCFPRDNIAFSRLAERLGSPAHIALATDKINDYQTQRLSRMIADALPGGGAVTILGLSYKPHTSVVERSHGVELAGALALAGYRVNVHDPAAIEQARHVLGDRVVYADDMASALRAAEAIVIMTAWPEYRALSPQAFQHATRKPVVFDCWRLLDRERFNDVIDLRWIGYGPHSQRDLTHQPLTHA